MDPGWLLGQLAFAFTFYKVDPAAVVDKCIEIAVDLIVPGKGAGENRWWMQHFRLLEQSASKTQKEMSIRSELRKWDEEVPWMHHELIVRYIVGAIVSGLVMSLYNSLFRSKRQSRRT